MEKKPVDLEERAALFAEKVRSFVRQLPRTVGNIEDVKQLIRASGSVPANCIEANEALGNRIASCDFASVAKKRRNASFGCACSTWAADRSLKPSGRHYGKRHTS
jgi:hypothetical protein